MAGPHVDPTPDPYSDGPFGDYGAPMGDTPNGRHHCKGSLPEPDTWPETDGWSPGELAAPGAAAATLAKRDAFRPGPYVLTHGRTRPSSNLDMMSLVRATGQARVEYLGITHAQALQLCQKPVSVAEVAAEIQQPLTVAKIILSDLIELKAVIASSPPLPDSYTNDPTILEAVLDGLRNLK